MRNDLEGEQPGFRATTRVVSDRLRPKLHSEERTLDTLGAVNGGNLGRGGPLFPDCMSILNQVRDCFNQLFP